MSEFAAPQDRSLDFWLARPVPRYTSYPPAPAFHTGIGAQQHADALARLRPHEPVSLYLHIPFCRELCLYCGCNTTVTHREDRIDAYLGFLQREMLQTLALIPHRPKMGAIHWGGGTPNILNNRALHEMFSLMREMCDLDDCGEIAMEIDPRQCHEAQIKTLASNGVTRVSLGVQDFNPDVQKLINRIQPFDRVARTCEMLRDGGINQINFDLIYGLPLQTPDSVAATARQVCSLRPQRIALFSYAHVPQLRKHQQVLEQAGLPDKYARLAMDQAARIVLRQAGYVEIGMDHFALPDADLTKALARRALHRNFQGYTTDTSPNLIALGASSIGCTAGGYFQNERMIEAYQDGIADGLSPVVRGLLLSDEDRVRAAIIEELMCYMNCDIGAVCTRFGFSLELLAPSFKAIEAMEQAGLVAWHGSVLHLRSPHRMAVRVVCQAFDQYAPSSIASRAA